MRDVGWDDPNHAEAFCDDATGGPTATVIENTFVFSHGAGSLLVANALSLNQCSMGATSKWFSAMVRLALTVALMDAPLLCAAFLRVHAGELGIVLANTGTFPRL